jgi:hypothetical protein
MDGLLLESLYLAQAVSDLLPIFFPTIGTQYIAQSQDRIDVGASPVHAGALETSFDHDFIANFH